MRVVAFFNNKGGVGKTSLVYHLAWMYAELGTRVLAVDLDPQANLTSMLVGEDRLERLWDEEGHEKTVYGAIRPLLEGTGDIASVHVEAVAEGFGAVLGDLALSRAEAELSTQWPECADGRPRAFRVISSLWRVIEEAGQRVGATIALVDVGPNLGALNRCALLSAHDIAIPLAPDLYSMQGLRNLGPTVAQWREEWNFRRERNTVANLSLPPGEMRPIGYIVMQHAVRLRYPIRAYDRWIKRIPKAYRESVLRQAAAPEGMEVSADPECLALLRHYRSLMPLAQEARKPMFMLRPADGAIGGHASAVRECRQDFNTLAVEIARRCGVPLGSA